MSQHVEKTQPTKSQLRCRTRGVFAQWLAESGGSLAITTYTSGKLVLVGCIKERLRFCAHHYPRPMGITVAGNQLALAVREQILLFWSDSKDRDSFTLRQKFDTGKVNAHDVAFGRRGVYFANTRYNAIARVSRTKRFVQCWQPPFIDGLIRRDRCHLNGLGMRDGQPSMATAFCATGNVGGWREQNRFTAGVVIDIQQNEVVTRGLCLPHSPRWHDGHWWLCDSGHGLLSTMDPQTGQCMDVCALPGFTRGLCLVGNYALVGLSKIRRKHILDAPPVRERFKNIAAGVALVDLRSGRQCGLLEFVRGGNEVFDVAWLTGVKQPSLLARREVA